MKLLIFLPFFYLLTHALCAQRQHLITISELKKLAQCPDQTCFGNTISAWGLTFKGTKKSKLNKVEGTQHRYVRSYPNPLFAEVTASYWILDDDARRVVLTSDNKDWISNLKTDIRQSGFALVGPEDQGYTCQEGNEVWHLNWKQPQLFTDTAPHTLTIYVTTTVAPAAAQTTKPRAEPPTASMPSSLGGDWDKNYPTSNVADLFNAERQYTAEQERQRGKVGNTYGRAEKVRIQATYLGQYRPLTTDRWASAHQMPLSFIGIQLKPGDLFQQETLFETKSGRVWMPVQEPLVASLKKEVQPGAATTLYTIFTSNHDFGGTLHLSFVINEFVVNKIQPTGGGSEERKGAVPVSDVKPTETGNSLSYQMRKVERHYARRNARGDTVGVADAEFTFPEFTEIRLNQLIRQKLVGASSYESEALKWVDDYKEEIANLKDEELQGTMGGTHRTDQVKVLRQTSRFVMLKDDNSWYGAGAAHSNYSEHYWVYDKQTKQFLNLSDLFTYPGLADLYSKGEAIFRRNEKISPQASLCQNFLFDKCQFALAKEFRLDRQAITFVYNPYEGKSFAAGIWTLSIPYASIQKNFKTEFWQLLQQEIIGTTKPTAVGSLPPGPALLFKSIKSKLTDAEKVAIFQKMGFRLAPDKQGFADESCDDRPYSAQVFIDDLNRDGTDEVQIIWGNLCTSGNTGSSTAVFIKNKAGVYQKNLDFPAAGYSELKTKNLGFPDLLIGGPGFEHPVWRWDGKKYQFFRRQRE